MTGPRRRRPVHLLATVLALAALLITGCADAAQGTPAGRTARAPSLATGRLVSLGRFSLWIRCTGEGRPVVVMDSGYNSNHTVWSKVRPRTSHLARTCVYDRSASGHSDDDGRLHTSADIVANLHTLLAHADLRGPFLLVGHSFGGMNMRLYAYTYPQQVAGLVEVDSSHEDYCRLAHDTESFCVDPAVVAGFKEVRAARHGPMRGSLGHLPLIVLTRDGSDPLWQRMQDQIASASSDSIHVLATGSGHSIEKDNPALVAAAVQVMEDAIRRDGGTLHACGPPLTVLGGRCLHS